VKNENSTEGERPVLNKKKPGLLSSFCC